MNHTAGTAEKCEDHMDRYESLHLPGSKWGQRLIHSMESISMRQGEQRAETEPWSAMVANSPFVRTTKKSSDIAEGVHVGNDDLDVSDADEKTRLGSASVEMIV